MIGQSILHVYLDQHRVLRIRLQYPLQVDQALDHRHQNDKYLLNLVR
jgi:hypothetical protein